MISSLGCIAYIFTAGLCLSQPNQSLQTTFRGLETQVQLSFQETDG